MGAGIGWLNSWQVDARCPSGSGGEAAAARWRCTTSSGWRGGSATARLRHRRSCVWCSRPVAPEYGLGRGKVFPADKAASLLNPLRRLVQSPSRTVAGMKLAANARVLEVGCGPGFFSPSIAQAVPSGQVFLLDLQHEMLRLAGDRVAGALRVQSDAMALPLVDGAVDAVFVSAMLGEVPDRDRCRRGDQAGLARRWSRDVRRDAPRQRLHPDAGATGSCRSARLRARRASRRSVAVRRTVPCCVIVVAGVTHGTCRIATTPM